MYLRLVHARAARAVMVHSEAQRALGHRSALLLSREVYVQRIRRARDYTLRTHLVEQLLTRISGDGWMAELAYRAGWQPPVAVDSVALHLPAPGALPPLRIAFASDFHAGPTTHPRAIAAACTTLARLQPDLLLLGGDFVSLDARYSEPLATLLGHVPARLGRFAVLGNHDLWADDHPIVRRLTAAGVQVLINANQRLPPPYDHVWICGMDDPTSGQPDSQKTVQGADGIRLVLMHSPEGLALLWPHRFELALCGHTHGGQIAWPSGRPIWIPPGRWNRRYPHGHHILDNDTAARLIVSRGVGYGGLPLRIFAHSEVLVATITWAHAASSAASRPV